MGQHPHSTVWDHGREQYHIPNRLSDAHCRFLDSNIGISRRTLRHVHVMLNETFDLSLSWTAFLALRKDAINEGRCRTTYLRHYYKGENSSEKELRLQRPFLKSRLAGRCQYLDKLNERVCGAETSGRFCEFHVREGHQIEIPDRARKNYIDSTLGKYG